MKNNKIKHFLIFSSFVTFNEVNISNIQAEAQQVMVVDKRY